MNTQNASLKRARRECIDPSGIQGSLSVNCMTEEAFLSPPAEMN